MGFAETRSSRSVLRQALTLKVPHLDLDDWSVAQYTEQALAVEPRHPARCRRLQLMSGVLADGKAVDQLGLVNPDGVLPQCVVVGGADVPLPSGTRRTSSPHAS